MALASDIPSQPTSASGLGDEKISISQLILSRLDDIQHNQDILRQDLSSLRQDLNSLRQEAKQDNTNLRQEIKQDINSVRQEVSALRYWSWGSILAVLVGTVTVILTLKP